jgi:hypothetical protein
LHAMLMRSLRWTGMPVSPGRTAGEFERRCGVVGKPTRGSELKERCLPVRRR